MNIKRLIMIAATAFISISGAASASTMVLGTSIQCSAGNAEGGISTADVTGNAGGSTDCWGLLKGNDPGPSGAGFEIDGMIYDFVAKKDIGGGLEGADIDLNVDGPPGQYGKWFFSALPAGYSDFLIVLKAANGFAVWQFAGADAASTSGTWNVAWGHDLSHFAVYAKESTVSPVPLPAGGLLLLGALGGLGLMRRRRKTT